MTLLISGTIPLRLGQKNKLMFIFKTSSLLLKTSLATLHLLGGHTKMLRLDTVDYTVGGISCFIESRKTERRELSGFCTKEWISGSICDFLQQVTAAVKKWIILHCVPNAQKLHICDYTSLECKGLRY